MKITNVLLSLSIAGFCFNQASAQIPHTKAASPAAKHIGDGVKSVGDSNRYVATSADARPEAFKPKGVNAKPVSQSERLNMTLIAPTACDSGCSGACGGSCDGGCGNLLDRLTARGCGRTWFSSESLLWFSENQDAPPLVTTSATGVFPVAGGNGVTTQFGGDNGIDQGLLTGFRVGGGIYFDDCQKVGLGGRAYGIFSGTAEYQNASNGATSIGIPFFNANPGVGAEDAYLVAFTTGAGQPVSSGSVNARADLDMIGADGSFHILLGRSNDHRIDLLAGYTYSKLKSSVGLETISTNLFTGDAIPDGTVFTTNDLFETENVFNGGHLGVLSSVVRSNVSLTTLAKVSFGNMRQTGDIRGFTTTEFGGGATTAAGGIFTQPSNIGPFARDVFAFIPELGIKLGYNVRENLQMTVGYTFMMWSNVGLAGEQIDRTVDPDQVVTRPTHTFVDSSFWMQGVDVGMSLTY